MALPEASYEARHSQDGQLQILYLAVAGNMYAMFVLRYIGGKHAARWPVHPAKRKTSG